MGLMKFFCDEAFVIINAEKATVKCSYNRQEISSIQEILGLKYFKFIFRKFHSRVVISTLMLLIGKVIP